MLKWTEQYSNYSAKAGFLWLTCNYTSTGYKIHVGNFSITNPEPDLEIAKGKAIKLARKLLNEALEAIIEN